MRRSFVVEHVPGRPLELTCDGEPVGKAVVDEVTCLLDGCLDNGAELAALLGVAPPPRPEALLALAYRRWGSGLPARMRGDFVLLVWDPAAGAGLIARDQLGVRPAYLHRAGRALRLATELPALLARMPRRPPPDPASVAHWIAASSRPGTATLYGGVERLAPGTMLLLDRRGSRAVRYWEPRYEEPVAGSAAELAERTRSGLEVAVGRRLAGDGATAVLLSGGLDSAAVAAVAAATGAEVSACSGTFPDHPAADEAELIAELRARLGLDGPIAAVREGGLIDSAAEHLDACGLPLLSWGDFWTLPLLREAAAAGAATVLGGDGGDELFGPRQGLVADQLWHGRPRRALATAGRLPGAGPQVPRREVARLLASQSLLGLPRPALAAVERARERRRAPSWLRPETRATLARSDDPTAWKRLDGPLWWAETAHGIAHRFDEIGVFEHLARRAGLAGLEARHPLLDLDLVELGLRQPPEATLDPRFTRPVLRAAVAGLVPDPIRLRPDKARFDSLVAGSLAGPEMSRLASLLLDPGAELGAFVDRGALRRELIEGRGALRVGGFRWMWFCWRLLTAELWLRRESGSPVLPRSPSMAAV
jgi:asparagine synthase (glutamine-hydrolysing)